MKTLNTLVNDLFKKGGGTASDNSISDYLTGFNQYAKNIGENITYPFRHPQKSLSFILSDLKGKYLALSNLVVANTADAVTTIINVDRYGISREMNGVVREYMESFGSIEGMAIHGGISLPFLIIGSYFTGKAFRRFYENDRNSRGKNINEKTVKLLENASFHLMAVPFYIFSANNLYQFLK